MEWITASDQTFGFRFLELKQINFLENNALLFYFIFTNKVGSKTKHALSHPLEEIQPLPPSEISS